MAKNPNIIDKKTIMESVFAISSLEKIKELYDYDPLNNRFIRKSDKINIQLTMKDIENEKMVK